MVVLVSVRVCDVCKRVGVETRRFTVTEGERTADTDRCVKHAGALEEILEVEKPQVEGEDFPAEDAPSVEAATAVPEATKPASKAAAGKTVAPMKRAAKKATAPRNAQSRRPKVMTIAEIEQSKRK